MDRTISVFLYAKAVVSLDKNIQNRLEVLQFSRETSAPPRQCRDIMAQISIDTLYRERVTFAVCIEDMLSWEDHIHVPVIPVCAVPLRLRSRIDHPLDRLGGLIPACHMAHDLPRLSADHRYDVDILPRFRSRSTLQIPVQLVQFHNFRSLCGYFLNFPPSGLFLLSNSLHWICSSPGSSRLHVR